MPTASPLGTLRVSPSGYRLSPNTKPQQPGGAYIVIKSPVNTPPVKNLLGLLYPWGSKPTRNANGPRVIPTDEHPHKIAWTTRAWATLIQQPAKSSSGAVTPATRQTHSGAINTTKLFKRSLTIRLKYSFHRSHLCSGTLPDKAFLDTTLSHAWPGQTAVRSSGKIGTPSWFY